MQGGTAEVTCSEGRAIKRLRGELAGDRSARTRFAAEMKIHRQMEHPHIIRVLDTGTDDRGPYLVLEWMDGLTLRELACARPPARVVRAIIRAVALALGYVHEQGYLHRDIKLENILVGKNGSIKLCDFGLACPIGYLPLGFEGTRAYAPLEQLRSKALSRATDLYSLGVMSYALVTGNLPFGHDREAERNAVMGEYPPLPAITPADIATIIDRCLRADAENRYQRADELLAVLDDDVATAAEIAAAVLTPYFDAPTAVEEPAPIKPSTAAHHRTPRPVRALAFWALTTSVTLSSGICGGARAPQAPQPEQASVQPEAEAKTKDTVPETHVHVDGADVFDLISQAQGTRIDVPDVFALMDQVKRE